MCITKDMTKKEDIEKRVRHYKTNITKLMNQSKAKHFHNFFSENNLNFLKTWQGICENININNTKSKEINCIQVNNKTINDAGKIKN